MTDDVVVGEVALRVGIVAVIGGFDFTERLKHVVADGIMAVGVKILRDAILLSHRRKIRHER